MPSSYRAKFLRKDTSAKGLRHLRLVREREGERERGRERERRALLSNCISSVYIPRNIYDDCWIVVGIDV